jgi:hypothetical protein
MASQPEQQQTDAPSVPLPNRRSRVELNTIHKNQPPIWSIEEAPGPGMPSVPLQAKCLAHGNGRHGVCCKELIGEDERQLVDPDIVRDVCVHLVILGVCLCSLTGFRIASSVSRTDLPYHSL